MKDQPWVSTTRLGSTSPTTSPSLPAAEEIPRPVEPVALWPPCAANMINATAALFERLQGCRGVLIPETLVLDASDSALHCRLSGARGTRVPCAVRTKARTVAERVRLCSRYYQTQSGLPAAEFAALTKQRRAPWPLPKVEPLLPFSLREFVAKRWSGARGLLRKHIGTSLREALLAEWHSGTRQLTVYEYPQRSWWQQARHTGLGTEVEDETVLLRVSSLCDRIEAHLALSGPTLSHIALMLQFHGATLWVLSCTGLRTCAEGEETSLPGPELLPPLKLLGVGTVKTAVPKAAECSHPGCSEPAHARSAEGLCYKHRTMSSWQAQGGEQDTPQWRRGKQDLFGLKKLHLRTTELKAYGGAKVQNRWEWAG